MKLSLQLTCLLGVMALQPAIAQRRAAEHFRVGADKIDITPPASALAPGDSIRDHLYARAIVIDNGQTCSALVSLDQGNLATDVVSKGIAEAAKVTHCPAQNFIVSATHTHSAGIGILNAQILPSREQQSQAITQAVINAHAKLRPGRIGFGTTRVYLNVNRDLYDGKWYQGPNPDGPSDKTLAVVTFIGEDNYPIAYYFNYAMHPNQFYLSGVISADFPGEAARYIEQRYTNGAVALFTQSASGDQNPLLTGPMQKLLGRRTLSAGFDDERFGATEPWKVGSMMINSNAQQVEQMKTPVSTAERAAYEEAIAQNGAWITAEGALLGESAIDVFKNGIHITQEAGEVWSGQQSFTCPGRDRLDQTAREGSLPPYKDGDDVKLTVGLLRLGNVYIASIDGEVYTDIWMHLKREAPVAKLMFVALANGRANSGYIYSDAAASHLTFQVIGSRLKPGCAETKIVDTLLSLIDKADAPISGKH